MDASMEYMYKKVDENGKITQIQAIYLIELAQLEGMIEHIDKWQSKSTLEANLKAMKEALGIK